MYSYVGQTRNQHIYTSTGRQLLTLQHSSRTHQQSGEMQAAMGRIEHFTLQGTWSIGTDTHTTAVEIETNHNYIKKPWHGHQ